MFDFERFPVYKKSRAAYTTVYTIVKNLSYMDQALGKQLLRSTASICLNIAEGSGKYSLKDKIRYYVIARASVHESVAAIQLLRDCAVLSDHLFIDLYEEFESISKMISHIIQSLRR